MHASDTATESVFAVLLHDYPELPEAALHKAQARYARVLSRQLGGDEAVENMLERIQRLEDASPDEIPADAEMLYKRWQKAVQAATEAGLQGLGEAQGCYFEVRRVRH